MEVFRFTLKNAKLRSYHTMSWLLVLLNLVAFFIFAFLQESLQADKPYVYGIAGMSLIFFYAIQKSNKKNLTGILFILFALLWLKWKMYPVFAVNIAFFFLYTYSVRRFEVMVNKEGISYPSFPKREINWNELQNIILKDGLLTIDYKNNKILQNELEKDDEVNEPAFNEFCKQQLIK